MPERRAVCHAKGIEIAILGADVHRGRIGAGRAVVDASVADGEGALPALGAVCRVVGDDESLVAEGVNSVVRHGDVGVAEARFSPDFPDLLTVGAIQRIQRAREAFIGGDINRVADDPWYVTGIPLYAQIHPADRAVRGLEGIEAVGGAGVDSVLRYGQA